jgi:hypothetical protein
MMGQRGWARSSNKFADALRRGAWYPVVDERGGEKLVVQVDQSQIEVAKGNLLIRVDPPTHWSIVVRTGVMRPTWSGPHSAGDTTYAVCPHCSERQFFDAKPNTLECRRCHRSSPVDWQTTC